MYETDEDLAREKVVIGKLARLLGCKPMKLPPERYFVDHALLQGNEVYAFAEAKVRHKEYDSYIISLHKWMWLERFAEHAQNASILVVQWPTKLGCVSVLPENCHRVATWGGRWDRGDWRDQEPMIRVPFDRFTILETTP